MMTFVGGDGLEEAGVSGGGLAISSRKAGTLAPHRTWGSGAQSALYPVLRERHKPYLIYEATFLRFLISCMCTDGGHVLRPLSGG